MKSEAPAISATSFPLPRKQFRGFILAFHIIFLGALACSLAARWQRPGWSWGTADIAILLLVIAQAGLYLRFFATRRTPGYPAWGGYFVTVMVLWLVTWRMERSFEWALLAYLGQLLGSMPPRYSLPGTAVAVVVYLPLKLGWDHITHMGPKEWLAWLGMALGWTVLGLFLHRLAATSLERAQLIEKLEAAQIQLKEAARREAELAAAQERERLARDLHDSLGHCLVTLSVQLETAQRLYAVDPTRAGVFMEEMKQLTRDTMEQLRHAISGMRNSVLGTRPLCQALRELAAEAGSAGGLKLESQIDPRGDQLTPVQAEALWRVAQEGLTNIRKHARASQAGLRLIVEDEAAQLTVSDNGLGLGEADQNWPGHYGLRGMRERIEALGGRFEARTGDGGGAVVEARIPLTKAS